MNIRPGTLRFCLASLLLAAPFLRAEPAPDGTVPITAKMLLEQMPNFYCFEYEGEPLPGKRYWLRVNDGTWIERYPNGMQTKFAVVGHLKVGDTEGTLVVKVSGDTETSGTDNHGGLEAFIPDKGSALMHHLYRNLARGDESWNDLGPMTNVE